MEGPFDSHGDHDMKRFLPALAVLVAAGVTLVSGIIHGHMSNRWGPSQATDAAAERLKQLPDRFGDWQGQAPEKMRDEVVNMLECAAYVHRAYVNQETGEVVRAVIFLGPAGPTSVHRPEVCYSSRNHRIHEKRREVRVSEGLEDEFWAVTFQSTGLDQSMLRVYYAWSSGGDWSATESPRFAFAGKPYLYKIQLAAGLVPGVDLKKNDPCRKFLKDFVPIAEGYLVEPSGN